MGRFLIAAFLLLGCTDIGQPVEIAQTGQRYKFEGGYGEDGWRGCDGVIPEPL